MSEINERWAALDAAKRVEFARDVVDAKMQAEKTYPSRWHFIAERTASLVKEKNAAYGSSFEDSVTIMRLLYPKGISVEQLEDSLAIVRVLDKLKRIATKKDAFNENPWQDILGYALLSLERSERGGTK